MADMSRTAWIKWANAQLAAQPKLQLYAKYTCSECGSRNVAEQANTLYEQYECCECNATTSPQTFGALAVLSP